MEIKKIKSLIGVVFVAIGLSILFNALELGILGLTFMGLIAGLIYYAQQKFKLNENVYLILSIVVFVLLSFSTRYINKEAFDLEGTWINGKGNDELIFEFLDDSEVSVILDKNQADDLIYDYSLKEDILSFSLNDTVRFKWNVTKLSKDYFEITEEGELLIFERHE